MAYRNVVKRRTEPRPQATCTKLVKFGRVVLELCELTDKQTKIYIFITILNEVSVH